VEPVYARRKVVIIIIVVTVSNQPGIIISEVPVISNLSFQRETRKQHG
jgi:hypothetical protein